MRDRRREERCREEREERCREARPEARGVTRRAGVEVHAAAAHHDMCHASAARARRHRRDRERCSGVTGVEATHRFDSARGAEDKAIPRGIRVAFQRSRDGATPRIGRGHVDPSPKEIRAHAYLLSLALALVRPRPGPCCVRRRRWIARRGRRGRHLDGQPAGVGDLRDLARRVVPHRRDLRA